MQVVVMFVIAFFFGFLLSRLWFIYSERLGTTVRKIERIIGLHKGYHFHHSMYGLTSFIVAPFTLTNNHVVTAVILIGFGLGIIIDHTIEEGFIFITKAEED